MIPAAPPDAGQMEKTPARQAFPALQPTIGRDSLDRFYEPFPFQSDRAGFVLRRGVLTRASGCPRGEPEGENRFA